MYRCLCGAVFAQPEVLRETERLGDGFSRRARYLRCPRCGLGEQYFDRADRRRGGASTHFESRRTL